MRSNAKGPFRAKYPDGTPYGGYRAYHPQLRKVVAVGTNDREEANRIWRDWYGHSGDGTGLGGQLRTSVQEIHQTTDLSSATTNGIEKNMINFDSPPEDSSNDVLASYLASSKPADTSAPIPPIPTAQPVRPETPIIPIARGPGRPPKKGQDPVEAAKKAERNAKLAAGLKGMVTQVNVVVAGMAVKLFGRDPATPDEAEIQMLREAWAAYIDDMFGKIDVEPWVLLLVGNVMVAMSMYANGEPIVKPKLPQVPGAEVKA